MTIKYSKTSFIFTTQMSSILPYYILVYNSCILKFLLSDRLPSANKSCVHCRYFLFAPALERTRIICLPQLSLPLSLNIIYSYNPVQKKGRLTNFLDYTEFSYDRIPTLFRVQRVTYKPLRCHSLYMYYLRPLPISKSGFLFFK